MNNLLNSGDIPNIFSKEEFFPLMDKIKSNLKKEKGSVIKGDSFQQLYNYFIESVTNHLHIILLFSPISSVLRKRFRMFPSLINCSNIIWYSQWPNQALSAVAEQILKVLNILIIYYYFVYLLLIINDLILKCFFFYLRK